MIQLSDHFDCKRLLRFTFPSIIMMVFTSIYGVVDGFFVSNYAGKTPFAAVNFIFPVLIILGCPGFMLGTGGSALIAKTMGEGDKKRANQIFSLLIYVGAAAGVVLGAAGIALLPSVAVLLGAEGRLLADCVTYGRIILLAGPFFMLQMEFQCLFATAEKPKLGLTVTVAAGVTNIVLDFVLVGLAGLGLRGAAIATGLGYSITAAAGFLVFGKRESLLHFQRPVLRGRVLLDASANGLSELATALVSGITTLLFNLAMLKYVGEDGVAAITIIMYVLMFVSALFMGYSYGVAPMISYFHGEGNREKLKKLVRFSLRFIMGTSAACVLVSILLTEPLVGVFTRPDSPVWDLAVTGNRLCSLALLFVGWNAFASGMFTALSNGAASAALAFSRSFLFTVASIQIMPVLLGGVTGVWLGVSRAMAAAAAAKYRGRYGY